MAERKGSDMTFHILKDLKNENGWREDLGWVLKW